MPGDGGYGWVVALSGMLLMVIVSSFFSVFGVVYMEMVEYYNTDKVVIAWVGATLQFVFGVAGRYVTLCVLSVLVSSN